MDPHAVTAVTPFRLLDLPREIRDDIYEAAIFDLSPPDMFMMAEDQDSVRLRKMNTNVLLMNRQVYWEARDIIVGRGQLVLVSITCRSFGFLDQILDALSGITGIDPAHSNLCVMSHDIYVPELAHDRIYDFHQANESDDWEFILHRQDALYFLRVVMGDLNQNIGLVLSSSATHTLDLRCFPTYSQHEFSSVYATQTLVLQKYRQVLRNLEHFLIEGVSIGWENGLYSAISQEIQSNDDREPTELIETLHALEQEGSRTLLLTGDVEAADIFWAEAIKKCLVAHLNFYYSGNPDLEEINQLPKASKTQVQRWIRLRGRYGDECAFPFLELWYKLISHRLSGAIRLLEQRRRLVFRHDHKPRAKDDYLDFILCCCRDLRFISGTLEEHPWSPQPADEAKLCLAAAVFFRLVHARDELVVAYKAILRAFELAPDDESIQQEKIGFEWCIRRLVDEGTLEDVPSSEYLTEPWWASPEVVF